MSTESRLRRRGAAGAFAAMIVVLAAACGDADAPEPPAEEASETEAVTQMPGVTDVQPQSIRFVADEAAGATLGVYTIPEAETAGEIRPGLRRYDAHLVRMVALTVSWCQGRTPDAEIDWRFLSQGGTIFLGSLPMSCGMAEGLFAEIGPGEDEVVSIEDGWEPSVRTTLLDVSTNTQVNRLRSAFYDTLIVLCADDVCPGQPVR